ncbi:PTS fructose transporter subunit IIB [Listeria aquatica]|uniref:Fusion of IIA, IIB and IIC component of mannitol/fructose-specific phosphotransferase system n=3 Tax=Listeria aquatica TaxID=1494960 RepID=W7B7G7_9LIST|nr:fructose PTS transporter subunit IIB [Listeria aquatica]EUJ21837.1 fusion of IIA, IIB and IIC component of mannitol/fructose-specific phosphotransferase system [Listeria aquatica FSL S10-1188]MBC1521538.1 PTS fructose transporter IIABC [Listeria aquatica]
MKIVGIAACTAGIAHTYIAKEKLSKAAEDRGHEIHIETQGLAGTQDALTQQDIDAADIVIIAADIKVNGRERFKDKKVVEVPTSLVVKSPTKLVEKVEQV